MKYFIRSVTVSFLITVIQAQPAYEISISSGIANIPMKEWNNWQNTFLSAEHTTDRLALIFGCEIEYFYKPNKSINLEVSRLTHSSVLKTVGFDNPFTEEVFSLKNTYNFITIPVTMGMKYYLPVRMKIYLAVKGDYYYTNIVTKTETIFKNPYDLSKKRYAENWHGYGYGIGVGFKRLINNYYSITTEFLYKYADGANFKFADGMILSREIGSPKIEFTGFYINIRLGRKF